MLELKLLADENFPHFITLLKERGEAPEDYYRWKYLEQPVHGHPTGFIAYLDNIPVGCIGIINRLYLAPDGKEYPATWFADWFVTITARGKGIGEVLMKEVRKTAAYNFGIPGPLKAQQVCSSAGYTKITGVLEEVTIYIHPFKCGYLRGSGSHLKRLVRGVKNSAIFFPTILKLNFSRSAPYSQNITLDDGALPLQASISSALSPSLKRTKEITAWLGKMPASATSRRNWWTIQTKEFYCWGFFEMDFWGLRKAIIFEVVSRQNGNELISVICKTLSRQGIDMVKYVSSFGLHYSHATYKYQLPVFYSGPKLPGEFVLSSLDKESSWREFAMN